MVALTVSTALGTSAGTYAINVNGQSGALMASTTLTLVVQAGSSSFTLSSSGPAVIAPGSSGTYDITVTPAGGTLPDAVSISSSPCAAAATCFFSATSIPAGSGTTHVSFTVATATSIPSGVYTITVTGTSGSQSASTVISFTVQAGLFNFSLQESGPAAIAVGSSAKYDITVTPSFGTFPNPVAITFSGCPAVSTCSLSSAQVPAESGQTDVFLTVVTTPPAARSAKRWALYSLWMPLAGLIVVGSLSIGSRPGSQRKLRSLIILAVLGLCCGCGGLQGGSAAAAGNPGTPVGTYTVVVIGTSGSLTGQTTISITVTKN